MIGACSEISGQRGRIGFYSCFRYGKEKEPTFRIRIGFLSEMHSDIFF